MTIKATLKLEKDQDGVRVIVRNRVTGADDSSVLAEAGKTYALELTDQHDVVLTPAMPGGETAEIGSVSEVEGRPAKKDAAPA